jgi:serine/threonine protein kinase
VIERPLAHGSMGYVYVARHTLTYARVALKVLR